LIEKKIPNSTKGYEVVTDSIKIPIWSCDFVNISDNTNSLNLNCFKYTYSEYSKPDAISNIEFLCDNTKYIIKSIILTCSQIKKKIVLDEPDININNNANRNDYEEIFHTYELEFDLIPEGYKILGLNDFLIIPTIHSINTKIQIDFELSNEHLNYLTNSNSFDNLFNSNQIDFWLRYDRYVMDTVPRKSVALSFSDYEEYPIIDLSEHLTKFLGNEYNDPTGMIRLANPNMIYPPNLNLLNPNPPNMIYPPNMINLPNMNYYQAVNEIQEQNEIQEENDVEDENEIDNKNNYSNKFIKLLKSFEYYKIVTETFFYILIILSLILHNFF
jgi:hypothetical protein